MYTKIAKPGWDAVSKNALDYSMIKEKQHFLVNTKYPQPTKKIQTLLDPNADIFNLNTPCQFIINVNAQISARVHLDYILTINDHW